MRAVLAGVAWAKARNARVCVCWPWEDPSETEKLFPIWFGPPLLKDGDQRHAYLFDSPLLQQTMQRPVKEGIWRRYPQEAADGWTVRLCEPEALEIDKLDLTGWPYPELWKPGPLVRSAIDSVKWPDGKVVGVHIRCALAQNTTPPIGEFLDRMAAIKAEFPNVRFFLATDAREIEDAVKARFPDAFCQDKGHYRYNDEGIARAAADLFLLRLCDWMIGSYNSSFSELAGWLRGGKYLPGWGRPGWMPGGRYEDARTPAVTEEIRKALT